ncbi:phosphatidylglycerol lysyltransferase domain-containing protein [Paenibacillus sp. D2_2]|nr:phosphatidylglycerol lysyltransferase domain-containing protein [Paenibacillus sp. D2_2]WMT42874.1 phosphatidylglycerol lysyltransferase domain-containing protein [Paenibacillus sp. D2_2]
MSGYTEKEKGFSIGWFDENYLQLAPLALITNQESEIIAFASIAPVYDHDVTLSIDLMRHLPNVPNGTMDQLFIRLFEFAGNRDIPASISVWLR